LRSKEKNKGDGWKPLQCWTYGGEHCRIDFPQHHGGRPQIYVANDAHIVRDVGQSIPRIYATLENIQTDHHVSIIEMDDKLCDQLVSILIDPGSNYSYVSPDLVDKCRLNKEVNAESWLVQLATGTKKRVHHYVRSCSFELNSMPTTSHLNVLPLGSYSMLLGMDWLYIHKTEVYSHEKSIE